MLHHKSPSRTCALKICARFTSNRSFQEVFFPLRIGRVTTNFFQRLALERFVFEGLTANLYASIPPRVSSPWSRNAKAPRIHTACFSPPRVLLSPRMARDFRFEGLTLG